MFLLVTFAWKKKPVHALSSGSTPAIETGEVVAFFVCVSAGLVHFFMNFVLSQPQNRYRLGQFNWACNFRRKCPSNARTTFFTCPARCGDRLPLHVSLPSTNEDNLPLEMHIYTTGTSTCPARLNAWRPFMNTADVVTKAINSLCHLCRKENFCGDLELR